MQLPRKGHLVKGCHPDYGQAHLPDASIQTKETPVALPSSDTNGS